MPQRWAHPRDRDSTDATSHGWPLWCLYAHKLLFKKTPQRSLSLWCQAARHPPRCFAASNKNVPQQGIRRSGTVSELNKSEPINQRLLQNITPVCAIRKKHGSTSSQNQSNTKERLRSKLENQRRYCHRKTDLFGENESCCSGTLKLESYCFVSLSKEFEVAPFLNSTSLSLMWRGGSAKSRLFAEPEKKQRESTIQY